MVKRQFRDAVSKGKVACNIVEILLTKTMVIGWLGLGLLVLCLVEEKSFVTACYILVQIISTIGYGDLTVQTHDGTKLFLSFYVLTCALFIGGKIISVIDRLIGMAEESIGDHIAKLRETDEEIEEDKERETHQRPNALSSNFRYAASAFFLALVVGTVFYGTFEKCTCGDAESLVEGCDDSSIEACEASGGYVKTYLDAWYMSCVSLTTIGFGDFAPKSKGGRIFSLIWMLAGVVCVGNFAVQFSEAFLSSDNMKKILLIDINEIFDKIDQDGSGELDRTEFLIYALLEYGLISPYELDMINEQFDELDLDNTGTLGREEILATFGRVREKSAAVANTHPLRQFLGFFGLWPEMHDSGHQNCGRHTVNWINKGAGGNHGARAGWAPKRIDPIIDRTGEDGPIDVSEYTAANSVGKPADEADDGFNHEKTAEAGEAKEGKDAEASPTAASAGSAGTTETKETKESTKSTPSSKSQATRSSQQKAKGKPKPKVGFAKQPTKDL